jgi:hypothetical protein
MTSSVVAAVILGLVGLVAIFALLSPLFRFLPGNKSEGGAARFSFSPTKYLLQLKSKSAMKSIEANFQTFSDHLAAGDLGRAEQSLKAAVDSACTVVTLSPEHVVGQLLGALSHLLSLADKHQIHIENLELIEELIHDRGGLLRAVVEAERSRVALKKRRAEGGKQVPEWAVLELKKQFEGIGDQLHTNRLSLLSQFGEAFQCIVRARSRVSLTVH